MGVSVLRAREYVDEPFILLMSDHLFDPEILVKLRRMPVEQDEAVLCVDTGLDGIFDMEDATKVMTQNRRVVKIGKELADFNAVDTGIFLCSPFLFSALEQSIAEGEGSLSGGIRVLAERGSMRTADIDGAFWLDVDTPEAHVHAEAGAVSQARQADRWFCVALFQSQNFHAHFSPARAYAHHAKPVVDCDDVVEFFVGVAGF